MATRRAVNAAAAAIRDRIANRTSKPRSPARQVMREANRDGRLSPTAKSRSNQAREASRIVDDFLATLSHELRTPLSSILGWAQLLRTQKLEPDEIADALAIIERNSLLQCRLIDDFLDASQIVTGTMQLHVRPISLISVIQAAVDVVLPAAQAKHSNIKWTLDARADRIFGDDDRLQQVVGHLLSNAVEFTTVNGVIDIALKAVEGHAQIVVSDNGEGIAAEFVPHVFDRFRQADGSTSRKHGGLGIGLAIVRHVVELHGGTVRAESAGKDCGAQFFVLLPLAHFETDAEREPQCN